MTFFESLKKWFYTKNSSAASSDARVPLLDASGNPKGSDTMANLASVLGDGNLRIKHGNVTSSQLDDLKDNFGEAYVMMSESPFGEEGFVFIDKIIVHVATIIKQTFVAYDGSICGYRVWNWSSNSWGSWYRGTLDMPTFYKDYNSVSALAEAMKLYIGEHSAIRAYYSESFTDKPATRGFYVRLDDGFPGGNGYELFFSHGTSDLWFRNESGGGWKKLALASV